MAAEDRRLDLDWLRIGAFGLLILYHCAIGFVDWHVTSVHRPEWLPRAMQLLNPWRLALLFVISGVVTGFMARRLAPAALAWQRLLRLGLPLLLGVVLVVPPQSWWELCFKAGYAHDLLHFWWHDYFAFHRQFCAPGPCLRLPAMNHLWFLGYLLAYTLGVLAVPAGLWRLARGWLARACTMGPAVLVLPWAVLLLARLVLHPSFDPVRGQVRDWYPHVFFGAVFTFGWLAAGTPEAWAALRRWRWWALGAAVLAWPAFQLMPHESLAYRACYTLYQWQAVAALLGFAQGWRLRDGPVRRYLSEAIFPFYLIHQTITVGLVFALRGAGLPAGAEAVVVIGGTALGCVAFHELARRSGPLRPWLGLSGRRAGGALSARRAGGALSGR